MEDPKPLAVSVYKKSTCGERPPETQCPVVALWSIAIYWPMNCTLKQYLLSSLPDDVIACVLPVCLTRSDNCTDLKETEQIDRAKEWKNIQ